MTEALRIRPATAADAPALADIYNHYIRDTVVTFEEECVSAQIMAARIAEVSALGLPWLVAEAADQLAGYAYANRWKTRSAYRFAVETTIYLRNGMEGRGIGKTLYSALLPPLRQCGIHVAIGGIALPNAASVAVHEKLGFRHLGTFHEVGFKQDRWVDVGYWELHLHP